MKRYAVVGLVLVGCGDDGPSMQKVDAAVGGADAQVDAPKQVDAAPMATMGLIEVTQGLEDGDTDSDVDVTFSNVLFGTVTGTDGPCTLYGFADDLPRYSAGTITITGTTQTITMTPDGVAPDVSYDSSAAIPYPAFTAGATIQVSAAGGTDVPAFNATVTGPAAIAGYTAPTTVSRSGYTATWTAGSGPGMWVIFAAIDGTSGDGNVGICRVPDNGSFTIPASTWAMTPSTATLGFVGVGRVAPTTVTIPGGSVIVQAVAYSLSGDVTITN